jgi:hypothetical protein
MFAFNMKILDQSEPALEIYQVPVKQQGVAGSFREDPVVAEMEWLLIDAISSWKQLNLVAGGARNVWKPSSSELHIREGLQSWESCLEFNPHLIGTRRNEGVVSSLQDARSGPNSACCKDMRIYSSDGCIYRI